MKTLLVYCIVALLRAWRYIIERNRNGLSLLFIPGMENIRWNIGIMKAYIVFKKSSTSVPAYKDYLISKEFRQISFRGMLPDLSSIPVIDKETYIKKYSIAERCRYGHIPARNVIVDESSGSSGVPTNWVRCKAERAANKRIINYAIGRQFGNKPKIIINAFALGSWATGMNVSMGCVDICILKSPGPDIKKIEQTFHLFGDTYPYIIMGYPPFLRQLADSTNVDWTQHDVSFVFGGEGMSEPLREYIMAKGIRKVYGSYGASDLDLNLASENDFTIGLRRLLINRKDIAARIIKHTGAMPMIFQYSPADFIFETNDKDELLVTLARPQYISPKIRYNIHDTGHVLRMFELKKILQDFNISITDISTTRNDLPILFHYGRSDMAIAFYGCKITPADVQEAIMRTPIMAESINSFFMRVSENDRLSKILDFHFELIQGQNNSGQLSEEAQNIFYKNLCDINQDFRESYRMLPDSSVLKVHYYVFNTGPFENNDVRIKAKYIR